MDKLPHVVIIGGGFGGLSAARHLARAPVRLTLIDRRNFHLFQPLLYQVATGGLSPANIASPLRDVLKKQKNARVLLAEATGIDPVNHQLILSDSRLDYDLLIVAAGSRPSYFGHDEWEQTAPGLKTLEDATAIRRRVLVAFEAAERETDPVARQEWLTFVIIGGGPTGVEMAGAVGELARYTLRRNFRSIDPAQARILLLEGADRVLPPYPPSLSAKAVKALNRLGVVVRTRNIVTGIEPEAVTIKEGDRTERLATHTILWTAGVQGSPLGRALGQATGAAVDRSGRVQVQADLSLPGHPEIFVIGDLAAAPPGTPQWPGVAQVAMQQGRYVARLIQQRLRGQAQAPFRYRDLGSLATIGRNAAVADFGRLRFSGFFAWLLWLFIHLINLVAFSNRVLVLAQWGFNYFTRNRSARLITGPSPFPLVKQSAAPPTEDGQAGSQEQAEPEKKTV
jgi:NADH dehydrogenase